MGQGTAFFAVKRRKTSLSAVAAEAWYGRLIIDPELKVFVLCTFLLRSIAFVSAYSDQHLVFHAHHPRHCKE